MGQGPDTWSARTLKAKTAKAWQECVRAEAGALAGYIPAVLDGDIKDVFSPIGYCACVTCGIVLPWRGTGKMDAGHFLGSRLPSILFHPQNCHPQCSGCNRDSGRPEHYTTWMLHVYGQATIDEIRAAKHGKSVKFSREQLVEMRDDYKKRIKVAKAAIETGEAGSPMDFHSRF